MNRKIFIIITLACFNFIGFAQQKPDWQKWSWLVGEWQGEGSGQPGQGTGTFTFSFDLDRNILVRKNHTEIPANQGNPKLIHDDLMIIYADSEGNPGRAVYFDNEGHTIFYTISYSENAIILTSDKTDNMPIFRLTYNKIDDEKTNIQFAMSKDGSVFINYLEGKSIRVKKADQRQHEE